MRFCRAVAVGLGLILMSAACAADERVVDADAEGASGGAVDGSQTVGPTRPLSVTRPSDTPALSRRNAVVDLSDIVFDTFDGGSVPLSEADEGTIERLFDAIEPIDGPLYQNAATADGWLGPDDLVVGYVDPAGGAWAYAVRVLNSREIVNDELAGLPIVITYCPLCGSGVVFERSMDERVLSFSNTSALYENDMVMVDRETGTYWWQVAGDGLVGPLAGQTLRLLPSQTTTWTSWSSQHPDTQVMVRPDGREYGNDSFAGYGSTLDAGRTPFPVRDGVLDDERLTPSTRVVVTTINGESRAWSVDTARVVETEVGGVAITVIADGTGARILDGAGEPLPLRSAFWFAVLTTDPEIQLGE